MIIFNFNIERHFIMFPLTVLLIMVAVIFNMSCQFYPTLQETHSKNLLESDADALSTVFDEKSEARQKFAVMLNEGNGEAKSSTRGEKNEELIFDASNITRDDCSIIAFGNLRPLLISLGFLKITCINKSKTEFSEDLSNLKNDSKTRQRFIKAIVKLLDEDKSRFNFSVVGRNSDEIIIKNSETPSTECYRFINSEWGKTAISIGFIRVTCKGREITTYSESLIGSN